MREHSLLTHLGGKEIIGPSCCVNCGLSAFYCWQYPVCDGKAGAALPKKAALAASREKGDGK